MKTVFIDNIITDYENETLFVTSQPETAGDLKEKELPYVLLVKTEEDLSKAWGHDYILFDDGSMTEREKEDYFQWAYSRQTRGGYVFLKGDRIDICEIAESDREGLYSLYEEKYAKKYLEAIPNKEGKDWQAYVDGQYARFDMSGYAMWTIRLKNGQMIGRVGFIEDDIEDGYISLGYLVDDNFRGQGYAKEAVGLVMEYAGQNLAHLSINAYVDKENKPSLHILEELKKNHQICINVK